MKRIRIKNFVNNTYLIPGKRGSSAEGTTQVQTIKKLRKVLEDDTPNYREKMGRIILLRAAKKEHRRQQGLKAMELLKNFKN